MPKQTLEAVQRALQGEWPNIESRDINNGVQIILPEGTKVNYFHSTGRVQVQGRDSDEKKTRARSAKTWLRSCACRRRRDTATART